MEDLPEHLRREAPDLSSMAPDEKLARGRELAEKLVTTDTTIDELEARLDGLKAERMELVMRTIPDFFDTLNTDKIGVPGADADVVVEPYYKANIAADWEPVRREAGFSWLEEAGHGDVIAVNVSVAFRRGEIEQARELQELIRTQFAGANSHEVSLSMGVPWGTLTALVKELIESGEEVPLEKLGATVGRIAKIKRRRKK